MKDPRTTETRLAVLTLVCVAVFAPIETFASWQMIGGASALVHPGYLGDVVGMVLSFVGARRSLRARPRQAPGVMCASHAWWAEMGWHATALRYHYVQRGEALFYGSPELWAAAGATAFVIVIFIRSLMLVYEAEEAGRAARPAS
jgi:hypothetical protein